VAGANSKIPTDGFNFFKRDTVFTPTFYIGVANIEDELKIGSADFE
jgi:hypothetical protein